MAAYLLNNLIQSSLLRYIQTLSPQDKDNCCINSAVFCLSGGSTKLAQDRLRSEFKNLNVNYKVHITNDSIACAFTAFQKGNLAK